MRKCVICHAPVPQNGDDRRRICESCAGKTMECICGCGAEGRTYALDARYRLLICRCSTRRVEL